MITVQQQIAKTKTWHKHTGLIKRSGWSWCEDQWYR